MKLHSSPEKHDDPSRLPRLPRLLYVISGNLSGQAGPLAAHCLSRDLQRTPSEPDLCTSLCLSPFSCQTPVTALRAAVVNMDASLMGSEDAMEKLLLLVPTPDDMQRLDKYMKSGQSTDTLATSDKVCVAILQQCGSIRLSYATATYSQTQHPGASIPLPDGWTG